MVMDLLSNQRLVAMFPASERSDYYAVQDRLQGWEATEGARMNVAIAKKKENE
jgi:hypothetical protein